MSARQSLLIELRRQNLPVYTDTIFKSDDRWAKDLYNIALGPNGAQFAGFISKYGGKDTYGAHNLPPLLEKWLGSPSACKRNIPTLRVVFGPGKYFFAWDKSGWCWDLEHPALEEFLTQNCGPGKDQPRLCALGTGGSYFLVTENSSYSYDLTGSSPELDKAFDEFACAGQPGVFKPGAFDKLIYISLSPFVAGNFISFFADGECYGNIPDEWREKCQPVTTSVIEYIKNPPKPKPTVVHQAPARNVTSNPTTRVRAPTSLPANRKRQSGGLGKMLFKSALNIGTAILKAEATVNNAGGYGGGGGGANFMPFDTSSNNFDMSSFWAPINSAAQDPIQ
ncbi:MAG: hypothetical protein Q9165_004822 [Trypethelium subeluteriae]